MTLTREEVAMLREAGSRIASAGDPDLCESPDGLADRIEAWFAEPAAPRSGRRPITEPEPGVILVYGRLARCVYAADGARVRFYTGTAIGDRIAWHDPERRGHMTRSAWDRLVARARDVPHG